jgi:hypothetical protein
MYLKKIILIIDYLARNSVDKFPSFMALSKELDFGIFLNKYVKLKSHD